MLPPCCAQRMRHAMRRKTGGRGRIETYEASPDYEPSGRFEISTLRNHLL